MSKEIAMMAVENATLILGAANRSVPRDVKEAERLRKIAKERLERIMAKESLKKKLGGSNGK